MEGKRRILLTGIVALMVAAVSVWVLIVVWRSMYRTDLATYGAFAVALVAVAVPGIAWVWRARVGQQRGELLPPVEVAQAVAERNKVAGHAFISYVREDSRQVDKLQRALQAAGVPVWRDTADLWPGEDWRAKIRSAITDNALVFIACFSQASLARGKSYQNEELILAIEQLRLRPPDEPWLIPVRFDDCEIPDRDIGGGRTLTSIQRADLFGDSSDEGTARLTAAVLQILRQPADTSAPKAKVPAHERLSHARMLERYKILGAMLALGEFSISELATLSGVGEPTVRTILRRETNYVEQLGREATGRRGGQPLRWRLRPDARERLRAQLREFEHTRA